MFGCVLVAGEGTYEGYEIEYRANHYRYDGCESQTVAFVGLQRLGDVGHLVQEGFHFLSDGIYKRSKSRNGQEALIKG